MFANGFVIASQMICVMFAIGGLSALLKINILEILAGDNKFSLIMLIIFVGLFVEKIARSSNEGQHDIIVRYFTKVDSKTKIKKRIVFFIYIVSIVGLFCTGPWLTSFYLPQEAETYFEPQGKVKTNEKGELFFLDNNGDSIPLRLKDEK